MTFTGSIVLLATVVSAVLAAIFFGHGLSEGAPQKMVVSLGLLILFVVLAVTLRKMLSGRHGGEGQAVHE